jgi:hypothetical protein
MTGSQPEPLRVEFASLEELEREHEQNLKNGGAMTPSAAAAEVGELRTAVLVHPDGGELALEARVAWVGEQGGRRVVALAFLDFGPGLRGRVAAFAAARGTAVAGAEPEPEPEPPGGERGRTPGIYDRLRGLNLAAQLKAAREGEATERMALERIYGKSVWEALLRNPRVTAPEVARIAGMGSLPVPLLELIVANGAWLASAAVRRGLLHNTRLGADAVAKVLRAMPRGELALVPRQTTYPVPVREAARRLLRP